MEEAISEAVLSGHTEDHVLAQLLDVTIISISEDREIFPNPLHEPILYRHFRRTVSDAIKGFAKAKKEMGIDF